MPKLAYYAAKTINGLLGDKPFSQRYAASNITSSGKPTVDNQTYALGFGDDALAVWKVGRNQLFFVALCVLLCHMLVLPVSEAKSLLPVLPIQTSGATGCPYIPRDTPADCGYYGISELSWRIESSSAVA